MPPSTTDGADAFPVTERNRVRRLHERGRYDKASIWPILDAAKLSLARVCWPT